MIEIEFNPAKDAIKREKHGIGLAAAAVIFRGPHVAQRSALPKDSSEERWLAIGRIEGRILVCVYTVRKGVYRVISLRAARIREKRAYEQAFQAK
jgi:uncharacterized protein